MSIKSYLKETREELKEVKFPTTTQTITFTTLVVVVSIIVAVVLGGADFGLKSLLAKILA
ncbi:MAG: Protein translocase subunit SecE [Patescibacteria group bacterium]|nr:Protein translocase subunit SecE [Patescibacteria group bacterium]